MGDMDDYYHPTKPPPNTKSSFNAVTMNSEWPVNLRILLVMVCSIVGTIINLYCFFVESNIRRTGKPFLCMTIVADLINTSGIMMIALVSLLSDKLNNVDTCHFLHFLGLNATYIHSFYYMLASIESCVKMSTDDEEQKHCMHWKRRILMVSIYVLALTLSGLGVYCSLDYDYCERVHKGNTMFRHGTFFLCFGIPFCVTIAHYVCISLFMHRKAKEDRQYRLQQYKKEFLVHYSNVTSYLIFTCLWMPTVLIVYSDIYVRSSTYYIWVWIALGRSVFTNLRYLLEKEFREITSNIFGYFFCKSPRQQPVTSNQVGPPPINSQFNDKEIWIRRNSPRSPLHIEDTEV